MRNLEDRVLRRVFGCVRVGVLTGDGENCVMSSDTTCNVATYCWHGRSKGRERERERAVRVKYRVN
jgi:hypothetical protein